MEYKMIGKWTPREDNSPLGMPVLTDNGEEIGRIVAIQPGIDQAGYVCMKLTIEGNTLAVPYLMSLGNGNGNNGQ